MTAQVDERTVFPPSDSVALDELARLLDGVPTADVVPGVGGTQAVLVGPDGQSVAIPAEVYEALVQVVDALRAGRAITLAPHAQRLTTQQAAEVLGVSRPTLIKLLETGQIPYEQPGRHRRVRLADVLAYRDRAREQRRVALDAMTRDAVSAGLYEAEPSEYTAALEQARQRKQGS
jgi:excisionase family DNA binding protein